MSLPPDSVGNDDHAGMRALHAPDASGGLTAKLFLAVNSPCMGIEPEIYNWPLLKEDEYDPATDLLNTIRLVAKEYKAEGMEDYTYRVNTVNRADFSAMQSLVARFNAELDKAMHIRRQQQRLATEARESTMPMMATTATTTTTTTTASAAASGGDPASTLPASTAQKIPFDLARHIMTQVYNRVVDDPRKLNNYKGFSAEVYGEVNFEMVDCLIRKVPITEKDIFIDLGSGVGQVVLQVALQTGCRTYGIEKRDLCANYANAMQVEFDRRVRWWGKTCGVHELEHGDFLEDSVRERIHEATIIFVNNYVFDPQLNLALRRRFEDLVSHGAKIVSSSAFAPLEKVKITTRNVGSLESVMKVRRIFYAGQGVSWTNRPVPFYSHIIDHTRLWRFLRKQNLQQTGGRESRRSVASSRPQQQRRNAGARTGTGGRSAHNPDGGGNENDDNGNDDDDDASSSSDSSTENEDFGDIFVEDYDTPDREASGNGISPFFSGNRRRNNSLKSASRSMTPMPPGAISNSSSSRPSSRSISPSLPSASKRPGSRLAPSSKGSGGSFSPLALHELPTHAEATASPPLPLPVPLPREKAPQKVILFKEDLIGESEDSFDSYDSENDDDFMASKRRRKGKSDEAGRRAASRKRSRSRSRKDDRSKQQARGSRSNSSGPSKSATSKSNFQPLLYSNPHALQDSPMDASHGFSAEDSQGSLAESGSLERSGLLTFRFSPDRWEEEHAHLLEAHPALSVDEFLQMPLTSITDAQLNDMAHYPLPAGGSENALLSCELDPDLVAMVAAAHDPSVPEYDRDTLTANVFAQCLSRYSRVMAEFIAQHAFRTPDLEKLRAEIEERQSQVEQLLEHYHGLVVQEEGLRTELGRAMCEKAGIRLPDTVQQGSLTELKALLRAAELHESSMRL